MDKEEALRLMEPYVRGLARRYHCKDAHWEDLRQEGRLGVLEAWERYVPGRASFTTFAYRWAQGKMLHYIRANALGVLELDNPDVQWEANRLTLKTRGRIGLEPKYVNPRMPRNVTPRMLQTLSTVTREGLVPKDAAVALGVSVKTVRETLLAIYRIWGVDNIIGAYNYAMREGLIDPPSKEN